uniref:Cytochrome P450 n=1 Tax=Ditylenchus dipsaci TaxID=166011 RepID=A0A915CXM2_9BILA
MDDEPTDFIYAYLREIERRKIEKNYEQSFYSMPQLRNCVLDLFITGQETTSLTLTWTILFVLHHPEVQEKIHLELDVLKAKSNSTKELIGLDAKTKLPYLCAVINESQRMTNYYPPIYTS